MNFVTDRTMEDVLLGTEKGFYNAGDLNRVEQNCRELAARIEQQGIRPIGLECKTDWAQPGMFKAEEWPTRPQMQRYLENIRRLCEAYGLEVDLPESMDNLDYAGANRIEQQQQKLYSIIKNTEKAAPHSGAAECGV